MSTQVIDKKVVEMQFNNKDFEKNVSQSMSTLDKLKKALNFDSVKTFDNLSKAANNIDLSGIGNAVDEASIKFSALEIAGVTAIAKITSSAMDFGVKFIKSLSLDQVTAGFDKYAEKTQAIQTIISATGNSMAYVDEQIQKLNWFTDETSYSLTDMTSNIATFTNANIPLKNAVTQMMGIAAAAGDAGRGVQAASHAMQGFSKAMGQQYMSRQTWKWISTSGIDTVRLKQAMLDAAVAAGTLKEAQEGVYETLAGHEVTIENFETNLKDKWMTTQVMEEGLSVYGAFANRLGEVIDELEYDGSTSTFIEVIEDYKEGAIDATQAAEELDISSENLKDILDELSSDEYDIGRHAFLMSQEAKTFKEAIDSVKDAVSTGWMTTFELIFGNYEEAKKLWTGLANDLWEAFASGGAERNRILEFWKQMGGRVELIKGLVSAVNLLVRPLSMVKQAFQSMFPDAQGMSKILFDLTQRFHNFMDSLQPSEERMLDIFWVFKGIFSVIKTGLSLITKLIHLILPVTRPLSSIVDIIFKLLGYVGKFLYIITEVINGSIELPSITQGIKDALSGLLSVLKGVFSVLGKGVLAAVVLLIKGFTTLIGKIVEFINETHPLQTALTVIGNILKAILPIILKIVTVLGAIVVGPIALVIAGIVKLGIAIKDFIVAANPLEKIINFLSKGFSAIGSGFATIIGKVGDGIGKLKEKIKGGYGEVGEGGFRTAKEVKTVGDAIISTFDRVVSGIKAGNIKVAFDGLKDGAKTTLDKIVESIKTFGGLKKATKDTPAVLGATREVVKGTTKEIKTANGEIMKATTYVKKMEDNYAGANVVIAQSGTLTREVAEEVEESTSIWEKLFNILKNLGKFLLAGGLLIISMFVKIGTTIKNLFTKTVYYIKQLVTGGMTLKEVLREIFGGLVEKFQNLGEKIKEVLDYFGIDWDKIVAAFTTLGDKTKEFFSTIDSGKVAAIIFAGAVIGIAGAIIKLSDSFKSVISGISSFFGNINKILKKQFFKSTAITDFAKAIALIAGSLIALTLVDQDDLKNVSDIMFRFAVVGALFAGAMAIIAAVVGDTKLAKGFETNSKLIIGLAGSVVVMAAALAILSKIDIVGNKTAAQAFVDWFSKLLVMFALLAELAVVASLFQKLAPKLTISAISFAALAGAFLMLALSLKALGEIKIPNLQENLWQLGVVIAAFGALLFGIGHLKLTNALSVLFLAKAINIIWPTIVMIATAIADKALPTLAKDADRNLKAAEAISAVLAGMGVLFYGMGNLSKLFLSIGASAIGLAIGVRILVSAINSMVATFKEMSPEEMNDAKKIIITFIAALGSVFLLITLVDNITQLIGAHIYSKSDKDEKFKMLGQKFLSMSIAMIALAVSVRIMVSSLKALSELVKKVDISTLWSLTGILSVLTIVFGAAMACAGYAARGKHAVGVIAVTAAALAIMVAAVGVLAYMIQKDPWYTAAGLAVLGALIMAFGYVLKLLAEIQTEAAGKAILAVTALVAIFGGFVLYLGAVLKSDDWKSYGIALGILAGIALLVGGLIFAITRIGKSNLDKEKVKYTIMTLIAIVGSMMGLGAEAALMSKYFDIVDIAWASTILVVLGGFITTFTAILAVAIAKKIPEAEKVNKVLNTMILVSSFMMALGVEAALISKYCDIAAIALASAVLVGLGAFITGFTAILAIAIAKNIPEAENVNKVLNTMILVSSFIMALGVEAALISKYCDPKALAIVAGIMVAMGAVVTGLTWLLVKVISKDIPEVDNINKVLNAFIIISSFILAFGVEASIIAGLVDPKAFGIVAGIIAGMGAAVTGLTWLLVQVISKDIPEVDNINKVLNAFIIISSFILALGLEAGIIAGLVDPKAFAIVGGIIAAMGAAVTGLTWLLVQVISKDIPEVDNINKVLNAFIIISSFMLAFGLEAGIIAGLVDPKAFAIVGAMMSAMAGAAAGITWFLLRIVADKTPSDQAWKRTMITYAAVVTSMIVLAAAIGYFSKFVSDPAIFAVFSGCIAGLAAATAGITWFLVRVVASRAPSKQAITRTLITYGAVVASMVILAAAMGKLSRTAKPKELALASLIMTVLTAAVVGLTALLMYVGKKFRDLKVSKMATTFAALGAIVAVTVILSIELYKLAELPPDGLTTAAWVIGILTTVITALAALIVVVASKFEADILMVGSILGMLLANIGIIWSIGNAISKLGEFDPEIIKQAGYTISLIAGVVNGISVLMTVLSSVAAASGVGIIGAIIAIIALIVACVMIYNIGEALMKAGTAIEQFAASMSTLQAINYEGVISGLQSLGTASNDIINFANSLSTLEPQLHVLEEMKTLMDDIGTTFENFSEAQQKAYDAGLAIGGDKHTKEGFVGGIAEALDWGCPVGVIENDIADDAVRSIEVMGEKTAAAAEAAGNETGSKWYDGVKEWSTDLYKLFDKWDRNDYDPFRVYDETVASFEWRHPIIASVISSFNDDDVQSLKDTVAEPFGELLGGGIAEGLTNSLNENIPLILGQLQGLLNGTGISFSFDGLFSGSGNGAKNQERTIIEYNKYVKGAGNTILEYNERTEGATKKTNILTQAWDKVNDVIKPVTDNIHSYAVEAGNYVEEMFNLGDAGEEAAGGIGSAGDAAEEAGGKASKGAKGFKEFRDSMVDTISNQLDIFSKFELKTEVSAQTMLENMRSNIDGFASWSHRMTVLAERGIDQGLYEKLAELGPKGYETMNAFYEMSEDQLKEANELFATSLTLPESQADIVGAGFQYAGEMAVQGFSNALDDHKAAHEAAHGLGQSAVDGINEALEVESPSKKTWLTGFYTVLGLANGITKNKTFPVTAADFMAFDVLDIIRKNLEHDKMYEIGKNCVIGLAEGIADPAAVEQLILSVEKVAGLIEEISKKKTEEESPSKVMRRIGKFATMGLAIGLKEAASNVRDAAASVADEALDAMGVDGRLQSAINAGLDFNPVITPLLDLSQLRGQLQEVNGMFGDETINGNGLFGQNGGTGYQQINYTQNNYSPKALSRIDIYRNTKNQISMMKGATG